MTWEAVYEALSQPFAPEDIEYRPGTPSRDQKRAQALAYAEVRCYEDRLNDVLGPDWGCRFITWGEQRLICELTVSVTLPDGTRREVVRTSTGEFGPKDMNSQGTSAEAQAFKRACVKFGLGRYLYDLPVSWVDYDSNSKRLLETPAPPKSRQTAPRRTTTESVSSPKTVMLSADRAASMQRELQKLGIEKPLQFVQKHLKTNRSYIELTEEEALEVWNVARQLKGAKAA